MKKRPGLAHFFKKKILIFGDNSSIVEGWFVEGLFKSTEGIAIVMVINSVTRKKLPNVSKSCPKMISLQK